MSATDDQPTPEAPRPQAPRRLGLSGKLLLLTIPLVMIAGLMIYVPAIANFRMNRLNDRLAAANTAALVLDAAPLGMVPDSLARQILTSVGARAVAIKMGQQRRLLASADLPAAIDHDIDMRTMTVWSAIVDSFETMLETGNQAIRVVGPAPGGAQFIEVVIDELPLRQAMYRFSRNLLLVSLGIAMLTAGLVYLALHYLFVRPMRRLTANLVGFHENPESSARIIVPSQRGDEIGVAERELSDMQRDLVSMLIQKSRLAALGLAVSKINHDLRNLLASSQLLSDQLASVPDPRVQRFAPKLMRSLERAIDVLPVDAVLWPRAGGRPRPPHDPGRARGRRGARIRRACRRRLDRLDQRDRARALDRCRSRTSCFACCSIWCATRRRRWKAAPRAMPRPCRSASPAAARARSRSSRCPTPAPACRRRRASICSRRSRPPAAPAAAGWACDRRRTGPRPWRRHPSGRRHHRRHLPDLDPGPPGGTAERPQRAGAGVSASDGDLRCFAGHLRAGFTVAKWIGQIPRFRTLPSGAGAGS